jgi:hypothetical protein
MSFIEIDHDSIITDLVGSESNRIRRNHPVVIRPFPRIDHCGIFTDLWTENYLRVKEGVFFQEPRQDVDVQLPGSKPLFNLFRTYP